MRFATSRQRRRAENRQLMTEKLGTDNRAAAVKSLGAT
jgi:hypothetical protein